MFSILELPILTNKRFPHRSATIVVRHSTRMVAEIVHGVVGWIGIVVMVTDIYAKNVPQVMRSILQSKVQINSPSCLLVND